MSGGVVVRASILARLLGLKLLRLDADIVLIPATLASPSLPSSAQLGQARELLARASTKLIRVEAPASRR